MMQLGFRIGLVMLKAPLPISHVARHVEVVLNGGGHAPGMEWRFNCGRKSWGECN